MKEILQERLDLYKVEIEENELNLRRNIILGGIFYFDMLQIPPQPKRIANWIICQLETPQVFLDIIQARDRIQINRKYLSDLRLIQIEFISDSKDHRMDCRL